MRVELLLKGTKVEHDARILGLRLREVEREGLGTALHVFGVVYIIPRVV
jgi:hypothetical protein